MKRILTAIAVAALIGVPAMAQKYVIDTKNTSLVIDAAEGEVPYFRYYGARLAEGDIVGAQLNTEKRKAYPTRLDSAPTPDALSVEMPDGNVTVNLRVERAALSSWEGGKTLDIYCKDPLYPTFKVQIHYRSFEAEDMIETWTDIINEGKKPVVLHRFDSGFLPIDEGDVWLVSLHGSWGNECKLVTEPLSRGTREISGHNGICNNAIAHSEVMFSLDGEPRESSGRVIGAALCYGGNFELRIVTKNDSAHRFHAGICPRDSWYTLAKGETFTTPKLAYSWSDEGMGGVSRNFHRWGRKYMLTHGGEPGEILLNSWEGVYFDINEEDMHRMASDIKEIGGELFVIDDGWFGSKKYPRNDDKQGLGDWDVLPEKLPHGIQAMADYCKSIGIKFGIWIEPEMCNIGSKLYEKHPDWVIGANGREIVPGRGGSQLVLDLCNPAVQDHVFSVLDKIMKQAPGVSYIKWDCNYLINSPGSPYLKNQNHLYIEYMRGLTKVLDRVREAYPDLAIQLCSSGGRRVSWGLLPWFDEFWTSDNTDALQRLRIQWGTSLFFPAEAMACHVSASPNHQTGRLIPLKYRIDVAMSGRLGFELQPSKLSEKEREICKNAVTDYKTIRDVVQCGDLYRLVSPFDKEGIASLMYVSPDKSQAAFFWWRMEFFRGEHLPRVPLEGLDPDKNYMVTELNKVEGEPVMALDGQVVSGRFLMSNGFRIPGKSAYFGSNDWHSHVIRLDALK